VGAAETQATQGGGQPGGLVVGAADRAFLHAQARLAEDLHRVDGSLRRPRGKLTRPPIPLSPPARAALYLASDATAMITSSTFAIDGGMSG
jgi:hypothetical protein